MPGLKEIRRRIHSVKNTKQITRAMKLVSAAKLRRAQEAALLGRRFGSELNLVCSALLGRIPEDFNHPLLRGGDGPRRIIVIAGERGLSGAYNANIIKSVQLREGSAGEWEVVTVGRRAGAAARRLGWNSVASLEDLLEDPFRWPLDEVADTIMEDFQKGRTGEVVLYYTRFVSAMSQVVTRERLLPFERHPAREGLPLIQRTDPQPTEIVVEVLPLYVRAKLREAALEAKASEHAARMSAMDSATRNADELIEKLRLYYNRARQSAITRELIDIVGGAEAIT